MRDRMKDREFGTSVVSGFKVLAAKYRQSFFDMQGDKSGASVLQLPNGKIVVTPDTQDITNKRFYEIKGRPWERNPGGNEPCYGIEAYRYRHALEFQKQCDPSEYWWAVWDHRLAGGKEKPKDTLDHWRAARFVDLDGKWIHVGEKHTWCGHSRDLVLLPHYWWPIELWQPLSSVWKQAA